ncbi:MAG TPA: DNA translocase FtsK [Opitutaceae bacterium]|jgi:hypothetical protein
MADELASSRSGASIDYEPPPLSLLEETNADSVAQNEREIRQVSENVMKVFSSLGVSVELGNVAAGPRTLHVEVLPAHGVRVERIMGLAEDLALGLGGLPVRMSLVPQHGAIGIEMSRLRHEPVRLRSVLESPEWLSTRAALPIAIGRMANGGMLLGDLVEMRHLLIGGSTGGGKSVWLDAMLAATVFRFGPGAVRFALIDGKGHDLAVYQSLPHAAFFAANEQECGWGLAWAVREMECRFESMARMNARSLADFNSRARSDEIEPLPRLFVVINEVGNVLARDPERRSDQLYQLAQRGQSCGIHLVATATPRPSAELLPGAIRERFSARIAFKVPSHWDSRSIIGIDGANHLFGQGDLFYLAPGVSAPLRAQGMVVTDDELSRVLQFLRLTRPPARAMASPRRQTDSVRSREATQPGTVSHSESMSEDNRSEGESMEHSSPLPPVGAPPSTSSNQLTVRQTPAAPDTQAGPVGGRRLPPEPTGLRRPIIVTNSSGPPLNAKPASLRWLWTPVIFLVAVWLLYLPFRLLTHRATDAPPAESARATVDENPQHIPAPPVSPIASKSPPALPITVAVTFSSQPDGATVLEAGAKLGVTPFSVPDVAVGAHIFEFRRAGFPDSIVKQHVQPNAGPVNIEQVWPLGTLTITSTPRGAIVLDAGVYVGVTPLRRENVEPGIHHLALVRSGYDPLKHDAWVVSGEELNWQGLLQETPSRVVSRPPIPVPPPPPQFPAASVSLELDTWAGSMTFFNRAAVPLQISAVLVTFKKLHRSSRVEVGETVQPGAKLNVKLKLTIHDGDSIGIVAVPALPPGAVTFSSH